MDWQPVLLSLKIAGCATALSLLLGLPLAWLLSRRRVPLRGLWSALVLLPMVLPPTVLGYYLLVAIGRQGALGRFLEERLGVVLVFTWQAAVLASAVVALPLLIRTAQAAFEAVDPDLEDAARVCGVSRWAMFWSLGLPLAWQGILAGTLLAFARAMGEFGATLMVAGNIHGQTQTLSTAIYDAVQAGQESRAHGLVILISAVTLAALLLIGRLGAPVSR